MGVLGPLGSAVRRVGRGVLVAAFPSVLINRWAEKAHKDIKNPYLSKIVEGMTYRKAYGFGETKERIGQLIAEDNPVEVPAEVAGRTPEEAYEQMMQRNGFGMRDRSRGMENLRREINMFRIGMGVALSLVVAGAVFWGWQSMLMATMAFLYAWLKGTVAAFYLWQSERKACLPFKQFSAEGGWFSVFGN